MRLCISAFHAALFLALLSVVSEMKRVVGYTDHEIVNTKRPLMGRGLLQAVVGSIVVFGVLVVTDQVSMRFGLEGSQRVADDAMGAVIAGAIFYLYEQRRARLLRERLNMIALMNHHVRNALQSIAFLAFETDRKKQTDIIKESVERIDWALREILPGKPTEDSEHG